MSAIVGHMERRLYMYFTVEKIFLEKGRHRALAASEHSTQVLDSSGVYC